MKKTIFAFIATLIVTMNFASAASTILGELSIVFREATDKIKLQPCDEAGSFNKKVSSLQLFVGDIDSDGQDNAGVELDEIRIKFFDKDTKRMDIRSVPALEVGESFDIDLGGEKCVKEIRVYGKVADCGCGVDPVSAITKESLITVFAE